MPWSYGIDLDGFRVTCMLFKLLDANLICQSRHLNLTKDYNFLVPAVRQLFFSQVRKTNFWVIAMQAGEARRPDELPFS